MTKLKCRKCGMRFEGEPSDTQDPLNLPCPNITKDCGDAVTYAKFSEKIYWTVRIKSRRFLKRKLRQVQNWYVEAKL